MIDKCIRHITFRILLLLPVMIAGLTACNRDMEPSPYSIQYTDSTIVVKVKGASFTMVKVEGGTFEMGATQEQGTDDPDAEEYPVHTVHVSTFYICQTEVTQELWYAVTGNNPSLMPGDKRRPVDCVKWDMCQEFIAALNEQLEHRLELRMPTEAEWEFAARGGNKSRHYKYAGSDNPDEVAWYEANSGQTTHSVGTKKPNELGIYDMSGNLWEWCQDWQGAYLPDEQTDPVGPEEGTHRVMRGGSWTYDQSFCRVSRRNYISNVIRASNCGLRLAMTF